MLTALFSCLARRISIVSAVIERPAIMDWAIDRDVWHLASTYKPPEYFVTAPGGELGAARPTELLSSTSATGVHWHDKPPMNGRELTADDFVYNFHRAYQVRAAASPKAGQYAEFLGYEVIESIDGHRQTYGCFQAEGGRPPRQDFLMADLTLRR